MFITPPDSGDAQKPAREIHFWQIVLHYSLLSASYSSSGLSRDYVLFSPDKMMLFILSRDWDRYMQKSGSLRFLRNL